MRRCSSGRSSSPIAPTASWCWSSWPRSGIEADVLLEPMRRDSGPAIAAGAAFAQSRDGDAIVLALAADHVVRDTAAFVAACRQGLAAAEPGASSPSASSPERPATEYGYINPGEVDFRRGRTRREVRREAGPGNGRRLRQGRAISGTAATSCFAPPCCSMNIATSMPAACRPSPTR